MPSSAHISNPVFFIASLIILVLGFVLSTCKRTPVGPQPGKAFNRVTLLVCTFFSAAAFSFGVFTNKSALAWNNFAAPLSNGLKIMHAGGNIPELKNDGLPDYLFRFIEFYGQVIYLVAPVSTLMTIAELLQEAGSMARMRRHSVLRNTFVITPLNQRTIELAKSIQAQYRKSKPGQSRHANIVFTGVRLKEAGSLVDSAREYGCIVLQQSLESVSLRVLRAVGFLPTRLIREAWDFAHNVRKPNGGQPWNPQVVVVFDNDDESSNLARATKLQEAMGEVRHGLEVTIFAIAQQRGAGMLAKKQSASNKVALHCVDWTYNLVEKTLHDYPLFLKSMQPPLPKPSKDAPNMGSSDNRRKERYLGWQRAMLKSNARHVVIVGAGHVGTEFLLQALSYSRISGMAFRFDVLDSVPDPTDKSACIAQQVINFRAPELLGKISKSENKSMHLSVGFTCCDATSGEYAEFIQNNFKSISYVFVCLGNDTLTTQIALKTNEILEREITRHCARQVNESDGLRMFAQYGRPLVVGVVDNDEMASTFTSNSGARHGQVQFVGAPSHMYTFRGMLMEQQRATDYERQQVRASVMHAKYRVFAYARRMRNESKGLWGVPIDWQADFQEAADFAQKRMPTELKQTQLAVWQYNNFCKTGLEPGSSTKKSRKWLERMEHSRWCFCTCAKGYCLASKEELQIYFRRNRRLATPYRDDESLLHPYLVPFDQLGSIDKTVRDLYEKNGLSPAESHTKKNKRHLLVQGWETVR